MWKGVCLKVNVGEVTSGAKRRKREKGKDDGHLKRSRG